MASRAFSTIKKVVARCVSGRREILAAYVFGSVASGRTRPDSDVDIAVLADPSIRSTQMLKYRLELMAEFGSALHRSDVDVVILNEAPPLLAHRILSKGKLVFERSASARVRFQVQTANRYMDLVPALEMHVRYLKKSAREDKIVG